MRQSKTMSLVESGTNIIVGYALAVATQFAVFPMFGMKVGVIENLGIGLIFTIVSLVRQYSLRRVFEFIRVRNGRWIWENQG